MSSFKYLDLLVGLIAMLFSTPFVEGTHQILAVSGLVGLSMSISYGLVLAIFSTIFALIRKLTSRGDAYSTHKGRQIVFGAAVLIVGGLMFTSVGGGASAEVEASDVVSPYFPYLISVLFCMGVGYVVADLIFATLNLIRGKQ